MTIQAGNGRVGLSADASRMATVVQSFAIAPRIVAGQLNDLRQITFENRHLVANTDARSITYTNEGLTLQGWLLAPKNLQPGKTYPMAVYVHGGPAHFQESRFGWDDTLPALLDHGYFVFEPNYRGSFGQGDDFTRANVWISAAATCVTFWRAWMPSKKSHPSTTSGSRSSVIPTAAS